MSVRLFGLSPDGIQVYEARMEDITDAKVSADRILEAMDYVSTVVAIMVVSNVSRCDDSFTLRCEPRFLFMIERETESDAS